MDFSQTRQATYMIAIVSEPCYAGGEQDRYGGRDGLANATTRPLCYYT